MGLEWAGPNIVVEREALGNPREGLVGMPGGGPGGAQWEHATAQLRPVVPRTVRPEGVPAARARPTSAGDELHHLQGW